MTTPNHHRTTSLPSGAGRRCLRTAALVSALLTPSCGLFGGLHVEGLAQGAQKPSNVAALVTVRDGDEPITELGASDFTIYENQKALSPTETGQRLLDRELAANYRVLLAVDTSAMTSADSRERLSKAIAGFVEKVREFEPVTVVAFDGQPNLKLFGDFARGDNTRVEASRFADLAPRDQSRNLNGAVVRAMGELERRLAQSNKALRIGTLVVFAAGPDLAGRVDEDELDQSLESHDYSIIAVGLGESAERPLRGVARNGFISVAGLDALGVAFEDAAYKVRNEYEKHYLLSYCSPARAGTRALRLEVRFTNQKGDDIKGEFKSEFDARGFGPGCDPERPPRLTPLGSAAAKPPSARAAAAPATPEGQPGKGAPEEVTPSEADKPVVLPPKRSGYAP